MIVIIDSELENFVQGRYLEAINIHFSLVFLEMTVFGDTGKYISSNIKLHLSNIKLQARDGLDS